MTNYKTLNTETIKINNIEILINTVQKTINTNNPFVHNYFTTTINANFVGGHELQKSEVDFYTKNYKLYI